MDDRYLHSEIENLQAPVALADVKDESGKGDGRDDKTGSGGRSGGSQGQKPPRKRSKPVLDEQSGHSGGHVSYGQAATIRNINHHVANSMRYKMPKLRILEDERNVQEQAQEYTANLKDQNEHEAVTVPLFEDVLLPKMPFEPEKNPAPILEDILMDVMPFSSGVEELVISKPEMNSNTVPAFNDRQVEKIPAEKIPELSKVSAAAKTAAPSKNIELEVKEDLFSEVIPETVETEKAVTVENELVVTAQPASEEVLSNNESAQQVVIKEELPVAAEKHVTETPKDNSVSFEIVNEKTVMFIKEENVDLATSVPENVLPATPAQPVKHTAVEFKAVNISADILETVPIEIFNLEVSDQQEVKQIITVDVADNTLPDLSFEPQVQETVAVVKTVSEKKEEWQQTANTVTIAVVAPMPVFNSGLKLEKTTTEQNPEPEKIFVVTGDSTPPSFEEAIREVVFNVRCNQAGQPGINLTDRAVCQDIQEQKFANQIDIFQVVPAPAAIQMNNRTDYFSSLLGQTMTYGNN